MGKWFVQDIIFLMRRIFLILLGSGLLGPGLLQGQEETNAFYARMGHADGLYEQEVRFATDQDELDYWKDQRAYEYALLQGEPEGYQSYLKAKHEVYAAHHALCSSSCKHGDYYWLQASYYIQFGPESTPQYTHQGRTGLLSASFRQ